MVRSFVLSSATLFVFLPFAAQAAVPTPMIFSDTFPEESAWYRSTDFANFSYMLPEEVVRIGLDISREAPEAPTRRLNDLYETVSLDGSEFEEGVNFVNVQFFGDEAETDASEVGSYRVRIDNTAPTNITATFGDEEIFLKAEDALSGVALYEVMVDGVSLARIDGDAAGVKALWQEQAAGKQVEVRVTDAVGNIASTTVVSVGVTKDECDTATPLQLLVAILTLLALSALLYAVAVRRASRLREDELQKEVEDTRAHVARIFSALKAEVKDQLTSLSARKRLTKREEEVLENMTAALALSEKLIQEEIDDFDEEE